MSNVSKHKSTRFYVSSLVNYSTVEPLISNYHWGGGGGGVKLVKIQHMHKTHI